MENIIYAHTRKQAVEDGEQVDVSTTAAEAGIRFPVFLTRHVFDAYVTVPPNVTLPGRGRTALGHCLDAPLRNQKRSQRWRPHRVFLLCPKRQPPPTVGETGCRLWRT
jgi:hypothetical protein